MKKRALEILLVLIVVVFIMVIKSKPITVSVEVNVKQPTKSVSEEKESPTVLDVSDETEDIITVEEEQHFKMCKWLDIGLTEEDYKLLCTTVYCEAGNQDIDTQYMVALTVLNRLYFWDFESIREVIYQKNAYEVTTWKNFENYGWTPQVQEAVEMALLENNHPLTMMYFRTKHYHTFGKEYKKSGDLYFSLEF